MIYDRKNSYDKESKKECQNRKQKTGCRFKKHYDDILDMMTGINIFFLLIPLRVKGSTNS
jgi:hypothetical protein